MAINTIKRNKFAKEVFASQERYQVLYGGAGAGKSVAAAQKIIWRMLMEPRHRILCLRKYATTLESSVIQLLQDTISDFDAWDAFHYSKTRPRAIQTKNYHGANNESQALFVGIDDPEKLKSLTRITGAWVEEATELEERDFIQLDLRIRGISSYYKQVILTFNPTNVENWVYRLFFGPDSEPYAENSRIIRTSYLDNRFIDPAYKERLDALKTIDPHYYKVYCLGEWGTTEEIIYRPFKEATFEKMAGVETFYGLDFGFTAPSALVQIQRKDNVLYVKELLYKSGLTNWDLKRELKALGVSNSSMIYADCASPGSIKDLKDSEGGLLGYTVLPAKKEVSDGIKSVQELHSNIVIHSASRNLIKEANGYQWRRGTRGELLEEPVKHADHLMDALRYAIHTHLKAKRNPNRAAIKKA